jgi:WD40 repeat protein
MAASPPNFPTQGDVPGLTLRYTLRGGEGPTRRIAWSPDGGLIAAPGGDGKVTVWNAEDGSKVYTIIPGEPTTYASAWSSDGQVLATGGRKGDISLWAVDDGRLVTRLDGRSSIIEGCENSCETFGTFVGI